MAEWLRSRCGALISATSCGQRRETGTSGPRVKPCLGYVVGHPQGMILFDTGMGSHPEVDAHYRPHRVELREALAAIGAGDL
jgi:hypothetical protein